MLSFEPRPLISQRRTVQRGWIDYNGHLNMAYYHVLFDKAIDDTFDRLGIGASYVTERKLSSFVLEVHVNYLQELSLDDPVVVHTQLLDRDSKRLHSFQQMHHAEAGYLAATSEQLHLHIDMSSRKSAVFPDDVQAAVDALWNAHRDLPRPEQAGQTIGIRRR